jgi:glycosyltransferase involved in cell wall biosynthesis
MKPKIVVSGVNVREAGALSIFRDALASLAEEYSDRYEIVALVKSRDLYDTAGVTYIEFPQIMHSWLARVRFEYWTAKKLSAQLNPKVWVSMHDMTPNVTADVRAVYCQNASPFYRPTLSEFFLDWRFGMFSLFYRYLYRINIHANQYVIVQQDWMRQEFRRLYGTRNVIVAHPESHVSNAWAANTDPEMRRPYSFFYPMFPRTYKNPELCLQAARILESRGFDQFELWITFSAAVNKYAAQVVKEFDDVRSVRWLGVVPRERILELYSEADCLMFPSRLETWGLPISEFRGFDKPMLLADMPYAHETAAGHSQVRFFDPQDANALADLMMRAATGEAIFDGAPDVAIDPPYARNWSELWKLVLSSA